MAEEIANQSPPLIANEPAGSPVGEASLPLRVERTDKLAFAATTLIALLVYTGTLAPEVTLGDTGVLATIGAYAGVPGPPAYPAWVIYSWLFTKLLPFSNIAWRIAFGSACATAIACGLVAQIISFAGNLLLAASPGYARLKASDRQTLRMVCSCIAGLCLAFCSTVWHEAVIVSTWPFGLLLFTSILWLLTRCCFGVRRCRWLYAALFLFGVLLTNNQEMLVALPGFICLLLLRDPRLGRDVGFCVLPLAALLMADSSMRVIPWFQPRIFANWPLTGTFAAGILMVIVAILFTRSSGVLWKPALIGCLCLACGWLFYLYPVVASMSTPPVNWGYPRNFEGFQWLFARGMFCGYESTASFGNYIRQVISVVRMTCHDFGWACSAIALIPVSLLLKPSQHARRWLLGLIAIEVCVSLAVVGMLNPGVDQQSWNLMQAHFGPALTIVAVFMGIGLMQIGTAVARPAARLSA